MSDPTYDAALEAVRAHLGASAFAHSLAVATKAAVLAEIYSVDVDAAKFAGLLHDWARESDSLTLLAEARAAGHEITAADERVPYLLHAKIGSAAAEVRFPGLSDAVLQAIERHTTGAADMSRLDMVVYLADLLEPARSYEGVERLRDMIGSVPLEELYAQAYALSLRHLIDERKIIHPSTVDAWNAIVTGKGR